MIQVLLIFFFSLLASSLNYLKKSVAKHHLSITSHQINDVFMMSCIFFSFL